jgi:hypothetical protein
MNNRIVIPVLAGIILLQAIVSVTTLRSIESKVQSIESKVDATHRSTEYLVYVAEQRLKRTGTH